MATTRMIAREELVKKLSTRASASREALKDFIKDQNVDYDEKMKAVARLNKKPRDESPVRLCRRCVSCGRARGVYRKFGLCRCCLRKAFNFGLVPGMKKSSW